MTLSFAWLKEYLPFAHTPQEIAEVLTSIGLEIETIEPVESIPGGLKGVVVGHVLNVTPHPNADRLRCTKISIGTDIPLSIVCGASNVEKGQKVAVALVGSTLYPKGSETPLKIQKGKIRGEVSEGMLCAEDELGLGKGHEGILVLDSSAPVGAPVAELLGVSTDFALEMGLTPNRTDAMGHFGVARDLGAALQYRGFSATPSLPEVKSPTVHPAVQAIPLRVQATDSCPRYMGLTVEGVCIEPSPEWMQKRLLSIGLKPVNNVVDFTNFILHETGHPLHAFDADKIEGKCIVVRHAKEKEVLVTLDEKSRTLHPEDLVICDENKPLCLAGVYGGLTSGVQHTTQSIFVESAWFHPAGIRKTAKRHGLSTDASFRYERGVDPTMTAFALNRFAQLISLYCPSARFSPIVSFETADEMYFSPRKVPFKPSKSNALMGYALDEKTMTSILTYLGMGVERHRDDEWIVTVPLYRWDVTRPADITEELLRIFGLNNVPFPEGMRVHLGNSPRLTPDRLRSVVSSYLMGHGGLESMSNSLTKTAYAEDHPYFKSHDVVEIINPLSQDLGLLRPTLLFGLLESVVYNFKRQQNSVFFFEFGHIYRKNGAKSPAELIDSHDSNTQQLAETEMLGMALAGDFTPSHWKTGARPTHFFLLKGLVEGLFAQVGLFDQVKELPLEGEGVHSCTGLLDEGILYSLKGQPVGYVGLASARALQQADATGPVYVAELHWSLISKKATSVQRLYTEPAKFPSTERDLALLVEKDISYRALHSACLKSKDKLLQHIALFDVYSGKNIPEGKISYGVRLTFQNPKGTLKDSEVDASVARIVKNLASECGAALRG